MRVKQRFIIYMCIFTAILDLLQAGRESTSAQDLLQAGGKSRRSSPAQNLLQAGGKRDTIAGLLQTSAIV